MSLPYQFSGISAFISRFFICRFYRKWTFFCWTFLDINFCPAVVSYLWAYALVLIRLCTFHILEEQEKLQWNLHAREDTMQGRVGVQAVLYTELLRKYQTENIAA